MSKFEVNFFKYFFHDTKSDVKYVKVLEKHESKGTLFFIRIIL